MFYSHKVNNCQTRDSENLSFRIERIKDISRPLQTKEFHDHSSSLYRKYRKESYIGERVSVMNVGKNKIHESSRYMRKGPIITS